MGRVENGMAAAALPLAATAWPIAEGSYLPVAGLVGLSGLIILGTLAPRLPLLHAVPFIGAPRLEASFKLDGDPVLELRKPTNRLAEGTLEIGVATKHRPGVSRADVNVLYPDLLELEPSDWEGNPEKRGRSMRPTDESLIPGRQTPYWSEEGRDFRGSRVLYYRIAAKGPGRFPIRLKIDSPDLKDAYQVDAELLVRPEEHPKSGPEPVEQPSSGRTTQARATRPAKPRPQPPPRPVTPSSSPPPTDQLSLKEELEQELAHGRRLRQGIPDRLTGGLGAAYFLLGGVKTTGEQVERWQANIEALLAGDKQRLKVFLYDPPRQINPAARSLSNILVSSLQEQMDRRLIQLERVIKTL